MTLKEKQAALNQLLESIQKYGEIETSYAENKLKVDSMNIQNQEEQEKQDVHRRTEANKFLEQIMGGMMQQPAQSQGQTANIS